MGHSIDTILNYIWTCYSLKPYTSRLHPSLINVLEAIFTEQNQIFASKCLKYYQFNFPKRLMRELHTYYLSLR